MNTIPKLKTMSVETTYKTLRLPREIVNPKRDWMILIGILVIFILGVIFFDGYMYREIVSGDMYVSLNKDELIVDSLKKNDLNKILDSFRSKKTNSENLRLENITDPSI